MVSITKNSLRLEYLSLLTTMFGVLMQNRDIMYLGATIYQSYMDNKLVNKIRSNHTNKYALEEMTQ